MLRVVFEDSIEKRGVKTKKFNFSSQRDFLP